jgi:hypothetical protein
MRLCIEQGDFDAFFACPFEIYPPDSPYISPFESDLRRMLYPAGNPLFRDSGAGTFFTAHDGDGPCGRITAHVHRTANELHGLKRGYFGFFDCRDDTEVARRLLDAAETWVRKHDCTIPLHRSALLTPTRSPAVAAVRLQGVLPHAHLRD